MGDTNDNNNSGSWTIIVLILIAGYFWHKSSGLTNQIKAYQAQVNEYEICVSDYQTHEQKFKTAITGALNDLQYGGEYNYHNAEYALGVDTTDVNCDVSTLDTLMQK